jgi:cation diffusion facilitator family transporter
MARPDEVRRVLGRVLILNLIVVAIKLIVGFRTGALSVLGAALESSLDLLNNVVGMVLVTIAARAPDETHPYGHAKFETLGALAIVTFLSISCFELLREAVVRLIHAQTPQRPSLSEIAFVGVTLAVNAMVVVYERRRGRELSSSFLIADAAHTHSDLYVTLLAIASLGSSWAGYGVLDPILAVLVALIIAWNGYQIPMEGATLETNADPSVGWHKSVPPNLRYEILSDAEFAEGQFLVRFGAGHGEAWVAQGCWVVPDFE